MLEIEAVEFDMIDGEFGEVVALDDERDRFDVLDDLEDEVDVEGPTSSGETAHISLEEDMEKREDAKVGVVT